MPSVSVLPSSPAHKAFGQSSASAKDSMGDSSRASGPSLNGLPNGSSSSPHSNADGGDGDGDSEPTVADIKDTVRRTVQSFRGASAISLLRTASDKAAEGASLERQGDTRGAYRALLSAAQVAQAVLEHAEFKQESSAGGKRGVVWNEWSDFQQVRESSVLL